MQSHKSETQMEERFEEHFRKKFPPDQKRGTSGVIHSAFGEKIKNCLKNPELFSKEFRHYVKKKKFRVFEIPSIGLKDVLVLPRSESDKEVLHAINKLAMVAIAFVYSYITLLYIADSNSMPMHACMHEFSYSLFTMVITESC